MPFGFARVRGCVFSQLSELKVIGKVVLLATQLRRKRAVTLHLRALPLRQFGVVEIGPGDSAATRLPGAASS